MIHVKTISVFLGVACACLTSLQLFAQDLSVNKIMAKGICAKLEKMPNLAYSGSGVKCWTTLFPWPGTDLHQANCVLSQKDGSLEKDAAWAQVTNYWAAASPAGRDHGSSAPQALVVNLPRMQTINVNRLIWCSKNCICSDYSLEYFIDGKWKLLYHDKANSEQIATYQFNPIVTDKLRLTMYVFAGEGRLLMRSFQLYNLEGNK